ncbi:uncharacterized protein LOC143039296 [Oratosquilla oratoria]|uniref:uncharacterized protein LOC143039296 n=1 Tax=Oratosquilla oratoria TaxID=337810 RepID=UPI003F7780CF
MMQSGQVMDERRKVIKVQSLKDAETKDKYQVAVDEKINLREEAAENWEDLQEIIKGVAEETLGTKMEGGSKKRHTPWWTEEVKCAVKEKVKALRKWLRHKTLETRIEYVTSRNKAEEVKRTAQQNVWKKLGETIEQDLKGGKKKILGLAKSYRKDKNMVHNIKDDKGNVIVEPNKINEKWQSYFKNLLNVGGEDIDEGIENEEDVKERQDQDDEITRNELQEAPKKMKNDKSPGCDALPIELIKEGSDALKEKILTILNKAWREETIPQSWGKTIILPVH